MKRNGKIKGVVTYEVSMPLPDCSVTIVDGPLHEDIAPLTDEAGYFWLDNLVPGNYIIKVNSIYGSTAKINVVVKPGETSLVEVDFKRSCNNDGDDGSEQIIYEEG